MFLILLLAPFISAHLYKPWLLYCHFCSADHFTLRLFGTKAQNIVIERSNHCPEMYVQIHQEIKPNLDLWGIQNLKCSCLDLYGKVFNYLITVIPTCLKFGLINVC